MNSCSLFRIKSIKKIFLIFVLLVFAFQLGASVLPHAHGTDWNHASHPECPLYQLSVHLVSGHVPVFLILFALILYSSFVSTSLARIFSFSKRSYHLRAPPVMFSLVVFQNEKSLHIQGAQNEKVYSKAGFICEHLPGHVF